MTGVQTCALPIFSSSTSSSPLARIHVTGFRTHLDNPDDLENLSLIASVKLFIQIGSHSQVLGGMFLEAAIQPMSGPNEEPFH